MSLVSSFFGTQCITATLLLWRICGMALGIKRFTDSGVAAPGLARSNDLAEKLTGRYFQQGLPPWMSEYNFLI